MTHEHSVTSHTAGEYLSIILAFFISDVRFETSTAIECYKILPGDHPRPVAELKTIISETGSVSIVRFSVGNAQKSLI
jgi:hypothetical protein